MKSSTRTIALAACLAWLIPATSQAFYNPGTGRWLSRDPVEEQTFDSALSARNRQRCSLQRHGFSALVRSGRPVVASQELNLYGFALNQPCQIVDYLGLMSCGRARPCCSIQYKVTAATPWPWSRKCIYSGTMTRAPPVISARYPRGCCPADISPNPYTTWTVYDGSSCLSTLPGEIVIWMWKPTDSPNGKDFTE
jgi:hypothetical protein